MLQFIIINPRTIYKNVVNLTHCTILFIYTMACINSWNFLMFFLFSPYLNKECLRYVCLVCFSLHATCVLKTHECVLLYCTFSFVVFFGNLFIKLLFVFLWVWIVFHRFFIIVHTYMFVIEYSLTILYPTIAKWIA